MTYHLSQIDSTNEYLKKLLSTGKPEEGTIVWTDFQTKGKGQKGNQWESAKGENLLCSILFYPQNLEINRQFILSQMVSVAIVEILAEEGINAAIKWPNDIYVDDRKIAGILIENSIGMQGLESSVIGIGLNVNQLNFYSNAPNPVSMRQIIGKEYHIPAILGNLKSKLFERYAQLCSNEESLIQNAYNHLLYRKNGFHLYQTGDEIFEASIDRIFTDGRLALALKNGDIRTFLFKEVSFVF